MIKKLSMLCMPLFLMSCNIISYSQVIPLIKTATFGVDDLKIDQEFIDNKEFSFIKVNVGRSAVAILSLALIEDDVFVWVSSSGEKLKTVNGKIISSFGVNYNTNFINYSNFLLDHAQPTINYSYDVMLTDPSAFIVQSATLKKIKVDKTIVDKSSLYYEEVVHTADFKWNFTNKYWVSKNGLVSKSIQSIHPLQPRFTIEFYYK